MSSITTLLKQSTVLFVILLLLSSCAKDKDKKSNTNTEALSEVSEAELQELAKGTLAEGMPLESLSSTQMYRLTDIMVEEAENAINGTDNDGNELSRTLESEKHLGFGFSAHQIADFQLPDWAQNVDCFLSGSITVDADESSLVGGEIAITFDQCLPTKSIMIHGTARLQFRASSPEANPSEYTVSLSIDKALVLLNERLYGFSGSYTLSRSETLKDVTNPDAGSNSETIQVVRMRRPGQQEMSCKTTVQADRRTDVFNSHTRCVVTLEERIPTHCFQVFSEFIAATGL